MPPVSEKQRRAMWAAAEGHSTLGIPEAVGREFVSKDANLITPKPGDTPATQLRNAIAAEIDAVNLYEQMAEDTEDEKVKKVLLDVAKEEKTHIGEFSTLLLKVDPEQAKEMKNGAVEVRGDSANELDIARAIQSGDLASPQQYENIWLFDVRVTGTGTAYRSALDEFVYRPPENFLTDEFLQRCNGLPLIFEHPKKSLLDTEEYRNRAIGTVILPYIKSDEVWGIAKVYDADAAQLMQTTHISTSPAVKVNAADSESYDLNDGKTLLIEGKPAYLDHLAICAAGVWDKGGEPTGVNTGESNMDPELKKMLDGLTSSVGAIATKVDSVSLRLDAVEKKDEEESKKEAEREEKERKDAEDKKFREDCPRKDGEKDEEYEERLDKHRKDCARKDGESEEEHKKRLDCMAADSKRKDAEEEKKRADSALKLENSDLKTRLAGVEERLGRINRELSSTERDELATAQARADGLAQHFGERASAPLAGETPISYRRRLAAKYQKHSAEFKDVKLDSLEGSVFDAIETRIYADAQTVAASPAIQLPGRLIPHVRTDSAGRRITSFTGDINAWMGHFKQGGPNGIRINKPGQGAMSNV
jgi:hypothetical protein